MIPDPDPWVKVKRLPNFGKISKILLKEKLKVQKQLDELYYDSSIYTAFVNKYVSNCISKRKKREDDLYKKYIEYIHSENPVIYKPGDY